MGPDIVDFPALPLMDGAFIELGEVFVITIHKKGGKRLSLHPDEPVCLLG